MREMEELRNIERRLRYSQILAVYTIINIYQLWGVVCKLQYTSGTHYKNIYDKTHSSLTPKFPSRRRLEG